MKSWFKTYELPTIVTNCSNNYGPYQFPEKLIPLVISNCLQNKEIPIYGDGTNIRDWIYVEDHCNILFKIIEKGKIGESYNIGGNQEISNIDLVKNICRIMDKEYPSDKSLKYQSLISFVKDRPGHDFRYALNNKKIFRKIGWKAKVSLKSGLLKTFDWYYNNKQFFKSVPKKFYIKRLGLKI